MSGRPRYSDPPPLASSSRLSKHVNTLDPETAHERHQRYHSLQQFYAHGRRPPRPAFKTELDVLKEHHQFIRSTDADPSSLSWEDNLALKYYNSLFREFAVVNLKHYKTGAIALRWRTEDEVISGVAHLTCASLRCRYHAPSPHLAALQLEQDHEDADPQTPLVETRLDEQEMTFGYMEEGVKKTALVKLVLCRECGRKLRYGKDKAKAAREGGTDAAGKRQRKEASEEMERDDKEDDGRYRPELPPDLEHERRRPHSRSRSPRSHSRRRSASPPPRRIHR